MLADHVERSDQDLEVKNTLEMKKKVCGEENDKVFN